jgi:hypothetical protein
MSKRTKERRRGKRQKNRHERRQQQHTGGGDWDCVAVPDELEVFKPEGGETYLIDVIPYIVGNHNKNADPGDEYFELSYAVYNNLGIDEKRFLAIGEMMGVRDPISEHFAALRKQNTEWDDMKAFKPKWRQLMLVFVHEQAEKGLQLFEGAYGTLGELLDEEIDGEEADYIDNFDDPDAGATLEVRFKAKNIGQTNPWILAAKINFIERKNGFDADGNGKLAREVLDDATKICLDDMLKIPTYTTLKAALDGVPMVDDAKDGKPVEEEYHDEPGKGVECDEYGEPVIDKEKPKIETRRRRKQPTAADLGIAKSGEVEHDEHGVCTVIRVAKDGLTVTIVDGDDNVHKGVDPTDLEPLGNGEDAQDPPAKEKPGARTANKRATGKTSRSAKSADSKARSKEEPETTTADDDWDKDWEE